jgi:hypothetical protein
MSDGGFTATLWPRRFGGGACTVTIRCYPFNSRKNPKELAGMLPRQWLHEVFREDVSTHRLGVTITQAEETTLVQVVRK